MTKRFLRFLPDTTTPSFDSDSSLITHRFALGFHTAAIAAFLVVLQTAAVAQDLIGIMPGPAASSSTSVHDYKLRSAGGDVNHDGHNDIAIHDHYYNFFDDVTDNVIIRSGVGGSILHTFTTPQNNCGFGSAVALGDVNGDGFAEVIVGASSFDTNTVSSAGRVFIYDGKTGALLFTMTGEYDSAGLGATVAVGDVDGDGRAEVIAASSLGDSSSPDIFVYSGATATERCRFETNPTTFTSGLPSIHVGPDMDGDQVKDLFVGAPLLDDDSYTNSGVLLVISGANCTILQELAFSGNDANFGEKISQIADLNRDQINDFVVYSRQTSVAFSGSDGSVLTQFAGLTNNFVGTGDLNFDGVGEILDAVTDDSDSIRIISGASGNVIGIIKDTDAAETLASVFDGSVSSSDLDFGLGLVETVDLDLNQDGVSDILTSATTIRVGNEYFGAVIAYSGTCPVKPDLTVVPLNEWKVPVGSSRVIALARVCGLNPTSTFTATLGTNTVPLFDNGQGGDAESGDGIYSGTVNYSAGLNQLKVSALVTNEVAIQVDRDINLVGVNNYDLVQVPYEWEPVEDASVLSSLIGQSGTAEVQMTFPFDFYGKLVQKLTVSTTGLIGVDGGSTQTANERMPTLKLLDGYIAPLWGGLVPTSSARIYYKTVGAPGTRRFVITWEGFEFQKQDPPQQGETSQVTFQAIIFEGSNYIRFNYKRVFSTVETKNKGSSATAGIQANAVLGRTFMHAEPVLNDNTAIEFRPFVSAVPTPIPPGATPAPPSYNLKLSVSYSAKKKVAKVSVSTTDAATGAVTALSDSSCTVRWYGSEGTAQTSAASLTYLGSTPAGNGVRAFSIKKMPPIAPAKVKKGKKGARFGFLAADLQCAASQVSTPPSTPVKLKLGTTKNGALAFNSWAKKLFKALAKVK